MQVPFVDLDKVITDTLNQVKEASNGYRASILGGALEPDEYKSQTGILLGLELASQILTQVSRSYINEQH
jgi:hypothetical protein